MPGSGGEVEWWDLGMNVNISRDKVLTYYSAFYDTTLARSLCLVSSWQEGKSRFLTKPSLTDGTSFSLFSVVFGWCRAVNV